jgi:hypothetical protein
MCMDEMQQKRRQALAPRLLTKKWRQPQTPARAHQDPPAPTPGPLSCSSPAGPLHLVLL